MKLQTHQFKAEIDGLKATLDDAVVSHLGPFVDDERQPLKDNEPALEIRLRNSDIRILVCSFLYKHSLEFQPGKKFCGESSVSNSISSPNLYV